MKVKERFVYIEFFRRLKKSEYNSYLESTDWEENEAGL